MPKKLQAPKAGSLGYEEKLRDNYYSIIPMPYPSANDPEALQKRAIYQKETARLHAEFKRDMFAHYEVTDHPKVEIAYRIAWDHGHSAGYAEVDSYFAELVEILRPYTTT